MRGSRRSVDSGSGHHPFSWKFTSYIGFHWNKQLDPHPGKVGFFWKILDPQEPWKISFLLKYICKPLDPPLCNLRTKKQTLSELFFCRLDLDLPPPPPPPWRKFEEPSMFDEMCFICIHVDNDLLLLSNFSFIQIEPAYYKSKKNTAPEFLKLISCSTHQSMAFIQLINVKMPTIVGILTFISRINTTSKSFKARKKLHHYAFYEHLKFCVRMS